MTQDSPYPQDDLTDATDSSASTDPDGAEFRPSAPGETPLGTPTGDGAPVDPARENTVWSGRTHWHHYLGRVVLGGIGICLGWWIISKLATHFKWVWSTTVLVDILLALVVFAAIAISIFYRVLQQRYRLTGQRLFIERGILSQTIDQTELIRVDDVRVHKRVIDRLLNMGTVEIRSTDATDQGISIRGIKGADEVAELVRNSMRSLRSKSLFIENL